MQYWFPEVPLWLLSLASAALIILINMMSVGSFGEVEFWLAGIKIAMIISFIVLGSFLMFGIIPSSDTPYLQNFTAHGGFTKRMVRHILGSACCYLFVWRLRADRSHINRD